MIFDVAMLAEVDGVAIGHLLQHYRHGEGQEDLCFALWRPSIGSSKYSGIIYRVILPQHEDRELHGNASFQPAYLTRALDMARQEKAGLAFMHSHPSQGWQGMSGSDVRAERDVLAYPAGATGLPLLGLTVGTDGYWSARFWERAEGEMMRRECERVRVVGADSYRVYFDNRIFPPPDRSEVLKRTIDTWGEEAQQNIARLKVGIVGLGSVGCIVAEGLARIGISSFTLIDHDLVEEHNLDRLLYSTERDIGTHKVDLANRKIRRHATAKDVQVIALPMSIRERTAYKAAIDCDLLFSCVDRPVGRDVLNYIAYTHLIPVIDGGVDAGPLNSHLLLTHWRAHLVGPGNQCMRCIGQYSTSDVSMELDGSLDDPSYITALPAEVRMNNQNVFPFSLGVASMQLNLMLRYILAQDWWPAIKQQDYRFVTQDIGFPTGSCRPNCEFPSRVALGDSIAPFYLVEKTKTHRYSPKSILYTCLSRVRAFLRGRRN